MENVVKKNLYIQTLKTFYSKQSKKQVFYKINQAVKIENLMFYFLNLSNF